MTSNISIAGGAGHTGPAFGAFDMQNVGMKIFGWAAAENDGCALYRLHIPFDELTRRGHEAGYGVQLPAPVRESADIIVGQRVCLTRPSTLWQIMAKDKRPDRPKLVYEVDDDLFSINPHTNPMARVLRHPDVRRNMIDNIRCADLVTVSTEPLAEIMRQWNDNVVVLPNSVRASIFDVPLPERRGMPDAGQVVFGWQGGHSHGADWARVHTTVTNLMDADPNVRMRFLGTLYGTGLDPARVDFFPWTTDLTAHYKRVAKFDVGLAPLEDSVFNRSKSGLRAVEYFSLGVPGVYSNVPAYRDIVEHGQTGFLARNGKEWREAIEALAGDPTLRLVMGNAARAAAAEMTIEKRATLWEDAYRSLL